MVRIPVCARSVLLIVTATVAISGIRCGLPHYCTECDECVRILRTGGPHQLRLIMPTLAPERQLKVYLCLAAFEKETLLDDIADPIAAQGATVMPAILSALKQSKQANDEWACHMYLYILQRMSEMKRYDLSADQDALCTIEEVLPKMATAKPEWMSHYMSPSDRKAYSALMHGNWTYEGPEHPATWQEWLDSLKKGQGGCQK